jgi:hypothetical protein
MNATVDHMISLTVFMTAILIFISIFSQSIQTAVVYEEHRALSIKTSDLIDTMLLNPGLPVNWGKNDTQPECLGLQDPEFSQYKLSTFSLMHLASTEPSVYYSGAYYSNVSGGFGSYLIAPPAPKTVNYSVASKLLGINETYGFQLSLTPTVTVFIEKTSSVPLKFSVTAEGTGYLLSNAPLSYNLIVANGEGNYPSYTVMSDKTVTDSSGSKQLTFPTVNGDTQSYGLIVYVYLNGLKGMGYYVHESPSLTKTVVPLVDSFTNKTVRIAHGDSVGQVSQPPYSQLSYNESFAILTEEYKLRRVLSTDPSSTGKVTCGSGTDPSYATISVPDNEGILIVTYKDTSSGQCGLVLMPWGLGSMGFTLTFGGNPAGQEWVTTDIRQVTVGGIAYQAKLALWNLSGYRVNG